MLQPYVSVKPNCITAYLKSDDRLHRSAQKLTGKQVRAGNNGTLGQAQRKRIRDTINTLVYVSKWKRVYSSDVQSGEKKDKQNSGKSFYFKLNLITLTLQEKQVQSDSYIVKNVLSKFLEAFKKRNPSLLYIWKAEVQDNGNLHFHLTTNCFINYEVLRDKWNKACLKGGLITDKSHRHSNSTDVHSIKNINNIASYLTSYIAKKDVYKKPLKKYLEKYKRELSRVDITEFKLPRRYFENLKRKVTCPLWGASKPLLNAKISVPAGDKSMEIALDRLAKSAIKELKDEFYTAYITDQVNFDKATTLKREWYSMMKQRLIGDTLNKNRYYHLPEYNL